MAFNVVPEEDDLDLGEGQTGTDNPEQGAEQGEAGTSPEGSGESDKNGDLDPNDPKDREVYALRKRLSQLAKKRRDERAEMNAKLDRLFESNQKIASEFDALRKEREEQAGRYSKEALLDVIGDDQVDGQKRKFAMEKLLEQTEKDILKKVQTPTTPDPAVSKEQAGRIWEAVASEYPDLWNPNSELSKAVRAEVRAMPRSVEEFRSTVKGAKESLSEEDPFFSGDTKPETKKPERRDRPMNQKGTSDVPGRTVSTPSTMQTKVKKYISLASAAYRTNGDADDTALSRFISFKQDLTNAGEREKVEKLAKESGQLPF